MFGICHCQQSRTLLTRKMMIDVAPSVENVDDLNPFLLIAEEDDVALMRQGANVVTQFRSVAAENSGQYGEMVAARHQLCDEGLSYRNVAAFLRNIAARSFLAEVK